MGVPQALWGQGSTGPAFLTRKYLTLLEAPAPLSTDVTVGGHSERQGGYKEAVDTLLGFELFSFHTGGRQGPSHCHGPLCQSWEASQDGESTGLSGWWGKTCK